MAQEKELEIVIKTDGTVEVEQIGWSGKGCHGAIDDLINKLGKEVSNKRKKDFFKEDKVRLNQKT